MLAPSVNVTVPAGAPCPEVGATIAVRVTDCPKTAVGADDVTTVLVPTTPIV